MTSSLVGSEMCIRDRDGEGGEEDEEDDEDDEDDDDDDDGGDDDDGAVAVSYTHLTLPTICSV
eukprot:11296373-Prorocentrum_lima.AAC.1